MNSHPLQLLMIAVCCVSVVSSSVAGAALPSRPLPTDIALRDGCVLVGQAVDIHGVALAKAPISIQQNGREVIRVVTNGNGEFTVAGLRGGVYLVVAPAFRGYYRMWEPRTAPPTASKSLMVASGNPTVRNLWRDGLKQIASVQSWVVEHPLMTTCIISAISYPLASADEGRDARP